MNAFVLGLLAGYGIAIPVGAIAVLIVQVSTAPCHATAAGSTSRAGLLPARRNPVSRWRVDAGLAGGSERRETLRGDL